MKIARGLKAAAKALVNAPAAESFHVAGKQVECPHCENILFHKREASLNTALSSLTHLEWTDREATVLICANCSRMEWFYDKVTADEPA
jgi:hypothetical protein